MFAARTISSSVLVVGVTAVLAAQAPVLDVKFGLWESTIVTSMSGMAMPQMDTSKLPPEQAAKIAEGMKGMGGQPVTQKNCITKEDLAKDSFMMPADAKMTCTRTITTNTKATFAADINCTGSRTVKGQINIESLDGGNAYKGTMKMASTGGNGQTLNLNMNMSGKYLGPVCGDVK
jgi:hypothetical protein